MPLQSAWDLLNTLQQNLKLHPVPRNDQRQVSQIVSEAVIKLLQVRRHCATVRQPAVQHCVVATALVVVVLESTSLESTM